MLAIVFDLETIRTHQKGQERHIIEIGAVKVDLNDEKPSVIDTFQQYIIPPTKYIPKSSRKMIGMEKEDMYKSIPLQQAIKKFIKWLENDDYYLCTWSRSDLDIIQHNYDVNRFNVSWIKNYNDIQLPISKALTGMDGVLGLKKAIELGGIPIEGKWHSGLSDAINTARLLIKYKENVLLQQKSIFEVFSIFHCPLFKTCRVCGETKYHNQFNSKMNICIPCETEKKLHSERKQLLLSKKSESKI
ncbi:3'-5' exonuclease [Heyndrickxia acidicola]|uniref:Exonuclease domain-containing protein n=1 Tax=Heyndrickxia acidicola TaxID=209389 RepID=A0ABU6ML65_9BACI|nr:3'-5' exonuclease [Heyndrickxia acidicola]MED1205429.1 exonuclease domain-containing protein [Heyndrickxia acidicola]